MLQTIPFRAYIIKEYAWYMHDPSYVPVMETIVDHVCQNLFFDAHVLDAPFHVDLEHETWDWCLDTYAQLQLFSYCKSERKYCYEPVVSVF